MIKTKDLVYYVKKEDYAKVLEKNLCSYENKAHRLYNDYIYYKSLYNNDEEYRKNDLGRFFGELKHGRKYMKYCDFIKHIEEIFNQLNFIMRTNYINVCFDVSDSFMKEIEFYFIDNDDIEIEIVEE